MRKAIATLAVSAVLAAVPVTPASAGSSCPDGWKKIGHSKKYFDESKDRNGNRKLCAKAIGGAGNTGLGFTVRDDTIT